MKHEIVEKNLTLMVILIVVVISIGGLVEIVPLLYSKSVIEPAEGIKPYTPLRLAGRDIYVREGCY
ncbi:MAG TPA: cbb3-type cytochrome c oxidase subunit II, partial [Gammaproteobacteria bacterium]